MWLTLLACTDADPADSAGKDTDTEDTADSGTTDPDFDPSFGGWEDCRLAIDVGQIESGIDQKMAFAPNVVQTEGGLEMWYSVANDDEESSIVMTTSMDGVDWEPPVVVTGPGLAGETDQIRVSSPQVVQDPDEGWVMYYDGVGLDQLVRIHKCTSENAREWTDCHVIKEPGDVPGIDDQGVQIPFVLHDEDTWRLYYDGFVDPDFQVMYATSTDGEHYSPGRVLLQPGFEGTYDQIATYSPFVWKEGSHYRMIYTGRTFDTSTADSVWEVKRLLSAVSTDGETWTDPQLALDLGCEGTYDTWRADEGMVLKVTDGWRIWYDGFDDPDYENGYRRILTAFRHE